MRLLPEVTKASVVLKGFLELIAQSIPKYYFDFSCNIISADHSIKISLVDMNLLCTKNDCEGNHICLFMLEIYK